MNNPTMHEQLSAASTVVADTGDIEAIARHKPVDATTNPSLLLAAARQPQYDHLLEESIVRAWTDAKPEISAVMDVLAVRFGVEILKLIPGRVSTEVDARLSFNTESTVDRAHRLIDLYSEAGIGRERVLIKIAATWEGIRAAERLQRDGIHCNLTLLFSFAQAAACADAGVTLISPFVGRIFDWYRKHDGVDGYESLDDPGVRSVTRIYNYLTHNKYDTEVMGASFRNVGQILALAGCDLLTIAPALLDELAGMTGKLETQLNAQTASAAAIPRVYQGEKDFRWHLNEDAMATEKLAEGIRKFSTDTITLENYLRERAAKQAAA